MTRSEYAIQHGLRFVGKPYHWGGQGPMGLDCSGLLVEIMRAVGFKGRKYDNTAQGIYDDTRIYSVDLPQPGDMVFFGKDNRSITHVGLCVQILEDLIWSPLILEAVGGRRGVDTPEEAQALSAMVTVRPMRDDAVAFTRPF